MFAPNKLAILPSRTLALCIWVFVACELIIIAHLDITPFWSTACAVLVLLQGIYCHRQWASLSSAQAIVQLDMQGQTLKFTRKNHCSQTATIDKASYISPLFCLLLLHSPDSIFRRDLVIVTRSNVHSRQSYRRLRVIGRFSV